MQSYCLTLRIFGVAIIGIAAIHLVLGPGADVLLGARLTDASLPDPVLDSQNRFYGVAFALYAAVLILASSNLPRYVTVLRWAFIIFFCAGLARLVSLLLTGWPSVPIMLLGAIELILPPIMLLALRRLKID